VQQAAQPEGSQETGNNPKPNDTYGITLIVALLGAGTSILTLFVIGYQTFIFRGQHEIMEGQRRLMRRQANISSQQITLARDEFLASHRPHMTIHQVTLLPDYSGARPDEAPLEAEFAIINSGTSAGTVISSAVELSYLYYDEIMPLRRMRRNEVIIPVRYEMGMADTRRIKGDDLSGLAFDEAGDPGFTKKLYLRGWLLYADDRERRRTTYFCWEYDRALERFRLTDDSEANATY